MIPVSTFMRRTLLPWPETHEGRAVVEGKGRRAFVPPDDPRNPKRRPAV